MGKLALTRAAIKGVLNPFGSIFDSVTAYVLGRVNAALNAIDIGRREKIQAVLNIAQKALSVMQAVRFLCPVKWQTAYVGTLDAVYNVITALDDRRLTIEELSNARAAFEKAYASWNGPDDETCVDVHALATS